LSGVADTACVMKSHLPDALPPARSPRRPRPSVVLGSIYAFLSLETDIEWLADPDAVPDELVGTLVLRLLRGLRSDALPSSVS
jgi:hypothetical protein